MSIWDDDPDEGRAPICPYCGVTALPAELSHVLDTEFVCDNMWPDELTEPWPRCPAHRNHALNPGGARGRACWVCADDPRVAVVIGELGRT